MGELQQRELLSLSNEQLSEILESLAQPPYRLRQLLDGLCRQRWSRLDQFSTLPQALRRQLADLGYSLGLPAIEKKFTSTDGTIRYLFAFSDGQSVETVWMPEGDGGEAGDGSEDGDAELRELAFSTQQSAHRKTNSGPDTSCHPERSESAVADERSRRTPISAGSREAVSPRERWDRATICVSSQVGCTLNCRFCHTGTMRLVRNLTPGEIVGQVMLARDALGEWPKAGQADFSELGDDLVDDNGGYSADGRLLTNIVMMGMGEPLYNFDHVRDALKIVMDGDGLALSKRRITLSTSGVVPMMARCGEEIGVNLAVSLHAVTKEIRDEIVPINRKYGLEELLQACADYPGASNARRITFEYVMLKDKNDTDAHARELVRLIRHYKLPAKVNLIPFNPWPGAIYECSAPERIRRFSDIVFEAGISAPVRTPRGRDIDAACGQLKTAAQKLSRAELDRLADEKQAALG